MDAPAPWERQPGEPARAYAAFTIYRDLPPAERSIRAVAERLGGHRSEKGRRSTRPLERWSTRWRWVERAAAFDAELDRRRREAMLKEARETQERHLRMARAMLTIVARRLQQIDPAELTPKDAARWVQVAAELERLALEQPTAVLEHRGTPAEQWVNAILEVWRRRQAGGEGGNGAGGSA